MVVCKDCPDRAIDCKTDCKKWKKYQFFKYLEKRKRQQDMDANGFLREGYDRRKQEWNRKKR